MKRRDLIKLLERNGWYFKREGANHSIYTNGVDNEPISHQREIKESVAKAIILCGPSRASASWTSAFKLLRNFSVPRFASLTLKRRGLK